MAHKWKDIKNKRRQCVHCFAIQKSKPFWNKDDKLIWRWCPLVGRCPKTKDGRPAKRRQKVLAAIKAGKHTPTEIAEHTRLSIQATRVALSLAKNPQTENQLPLVTNPRRGWWELTKETK